MIQQRLEKLKIKRIREDYPQVNYLDDKGIQWIELNRGCTRMCAFCWADPNYKTFDIPEIISNKVQIIGENILQDLNILYKFADLGKMRVDDKVVYYGLGNGFDYRLVNPEIAALSKSCRLGNINNKGNWYNGVNLAWDGSMNEELNVQIALDYLSL